MKKMRVPFTLYTLLLLLILPLRFLQAQNTTTAPFELNKGDRVVFVGNSLFENELEFGYLELAITSRWPDKDITFRNIGWSGDNVFGEARSYITKPPTAYELLIEQITKAKPTVIFMAYGGIESQEGEAGLPRFRDGLNQLLDRISGLGASVIFLSPIPVFSTGSPDLPVQKNSDVQLYGSTISSIAASKGMRFIDVFKPLNEWSKTKTISDNGIHLNKLGYYYLALALENGLQLSGRNEEASINFSKREGIVSAGSVRVTAENEPGSLLTFRWDEKYLPLPIPREILKEADQVRRLKIGGLKKGFYTLSADGTPILTASAAQWATGLALTHGASFDQAEHLREMIVKKNDLYFQQYRPLNRTYILGFRSYEQGRHKQGLEDLNILITWLEAQIATHRVPKAPVYQLTATK